MEPDARRSRPRVLRTASLAGLAVAAVLASAAPAEATQLVRYERSGGFAGRTVRLVVENGGACRQTEGRSGDDKSFKVPVSKLHALKRDLKAARFSSLARSYKPDYVVNDGIAQSVTYKGKTVVVSTGGHPPARLRKLLSRLSSLAT
jgi:hypothetical protein